MFVKIWGECVQKVIDTDTPHYAGSARVNVHSWSHENEHLNY